MTLFAWQCCARSFTSGFTRNIGLYLSHQVSILHVLQRTGPTEGDGRPFLCFLSDLCRGLFSSHVFDTHVLESLSHVALRLFYCHLVERLFGYFIYFLYVYSVSVSLCKVLGIETRSLHVWQTCSITEACPQPLYFLWDGFCHVCLSVPFIKLYNLSAVKFSHSSVVLFVSAVSWDNTSSFISESCNNVTPLSYPV